MHRGATEDQRATDRSGYSPGMAGKDTSIFEGRNFLPKPYSLGKLAQFVRDCLDAQEQRN